MAVAGALPVDDRVAGVVVPIIERVFVRVLLLNPPVNHLRRNLPSLRAHFK